jgi:hypothetical protein
MDPPSSIALSARAAIDEFSPPVPSAGCLVSAAMRMAAENARQVCFDRLIA